jgi:hypothetical protein
VRYIAIILCQISLLRIRLIKPLNLKNTASSAVPQETLGNLNQIVTQREFCLDLKDGVYVGQVVEKRRGLGTEKQMHGKGMFSFYFPGSERLNGRTYIGAFECGVRSGFGTLFVGDAPFYEGNWSHGRRHGHGVTYSKSGDIVHDGEWKNGTRAKNDIA